MRAALGKSRKKSFQIKSNGASDPAVVNAAKIEIPADNKAGVNLRYFQKSFECISDWQKQELKALSNWIERMSKSSEADITSVTKSCHAHLGKKKTPPQQVSPDVKMYSLDVTPAGRAHGFFAGGSFFLVWVDRKGRILGH